MQSSEQSPTPTRVSARTISPAKRGRSQSYTQANEGHEGHEDQADTPIAPEATEPKPAALLDVLKEQSRLAQLKGPLTTSHISDISSDKARITPTLYSNKKTSEMDAIQWIKISKEELDVNLTHFSTNPLDFMDRNTIKECNKAAGGGEHKFSPLKKVALVDPGFKILVKVFCDDPNGLRTPEFEKENDEPFDSDKRKSEWIIDAVRSALQTADVPMDEALTILKFSKPTFDWHQLVLTREALAALSPVRALIDPRSRVLVLLRAWNLRAPYSPIIRFEGITTDADTNDDAQANAKKLFKTQIEESFKKYDLIVSRMEDVTEYRGGNTSHSFDVHFTFTKGKPPVPLEPRCFPPTYSGPDGARNLTASWSRPCKYCLSEGHAKADRGRCPWFAFKFPEYLNPSTIGYRNLKPGQSEYRQKRKRDQQEAPTDIRPTEKKRRIEADQ